MLFAVFFLTRLKSIPDTAASLEEKPCTGSKKRYILLKSLGPGEDKPHVLENNNCL